MAHSAKLDPKLKKFIGNMMKDIMKNKTATLTDKCKVADRALKLAAIEAKIDDAGYGSGFGANEEPGESNDED